MKKILLMVTVLILVATYGPALAENITVTGDMGSRIHFEIDKKVTTVPGLQNLILSFVVPETFTSPTYRQDVSGFDLKFTPVPLDKTSRTDGRGNRIITASWQTPPAAVDVHLSFDAFNATKLETLDTSAPFPLTSVPQDVADYLKATGQVQANDIRVRDLAAELVKDVDTEFAAVQRIITFVVDYIHYVNPPVQYDALYSLASGKGNCQNFSHLSAALMRASGIPVRIVNGVTLNRPLNITRGGGMLTFKMGQGHHSWTEVWFPDLGWVPFDPQQTGMFVSNRFIRFEVGIDNDETKNDGLLRWSRTGIRQGEPAIREEIRADFVEDKVVLNGRREETGPKSFLLFPLVKAEAKNIEVTTPSPLPVTLTPADPSLSPDPIASSAPLTSPVPLPEADTGKKGIFSDAWLAIKNAFGRTGAAMPSFFSRIREKTLITFKAEAGAIEEVPLPEAGPVTLGNLEFPADVDFAFPPVPAVPTAENSFEKTRSFLVETAEYVTSERTQYAQVFVLEKPLELERIGLALHKFGGDGQLWIDVCRDDNGKPGEIIATSDMVDLGNLAEKPGYRWTDFPFSSNKPAMAPGSYWIALGFTGSPIVNWFYTYGKPVGPTDGTRYKGIFDKDWSGSLSYEFNYRVAGNITK